MSTIEGSRHVAKSATEVYDRLRFLLAVATHLQPRKLRVAVGPASAKNRRHRAFRGPSGTDIHWTITPRPFIKAWMTTIAVPFCWAIFPPILVYKALRVEPRAFMENLLAGV